MNVNDTVRINPELDPDGARRFPGVWKVIKVSKVNVVIEPLAGGRGLRINPIALIAADPNEPAPALTTGIPYRAPLSLGTLVRWNGAARHGYSAATLFVVIADKVERVNIAKVGGDDGKYWRIPAALLTVVTVDEAQIAVSA